jgi:hypothetical protein
MYKKLILFIIVATLGTTGIMFMLNDKFDSKKEKTKIEFNDGRIVKCHELTTRNDGTTKFKDSLNVINVVPTVSIKTITY